MNPDNTDIMSVTHVIYTLCIANIAINPALSKTSKKNPQNFQSRSGIVIRKAWLEALE